MKNAKEIQTGVQVCFYPFLFVWEGHYSEKNIATAQNI